VKYTLELPYIIGPEPGLGPGLVTAFEKKFKITYYYEWQARFGHQRAFPWPYI
jgi:hypothetical protein